MKEMHKKEEKKDKEQQTMNKRIPVLAFSC